MSHDRGCPCGKEGDDEYSACDQNYCHRRYPQKSIKKIVEEVFEQNKDMGYY